MSKDDDLPRFDDGRHRCWWCGGDDEYQRYHDDEWGFPVDDDVHLFEKICLEGFQAGLSWLTILRKRANFRAAFAAFDPALVANFGARDRKRLMADAGIVRHGGKIDSTINNAQRALEIIGDFGSLAAYFWTFEPPQSTRPKKITRGEIPSQTPASARLSKDLKGRGFSFVGPTTVYAFMQAMGLVNDHLEGCDSRGEVEAARRAFTRPV